MNEIFPSIKDFELPLIVTSDDEHQKFKIDKIEVVTESFLYFVVQILVSCCIAFLVVAASCEDVKKETEQLQEESQNIEKRGLHGSFGGSEWSGYSGGSSHGGGGGGGSSYGGSSYGGGEDHGHHHEHIKTVTIEKKYPVPYEVIKKVPYTVEKKVSGRLFSDLKSSTLCI